MNFNTISGLPRAGSTLMVNVLNQNPSIYSSNTSILPGVLNSVRAMRSGSVEFKAAQTKGNDEVLEKMREVLRSIVTSTYSHIDKPIVFDKSRAWSLNAPLLGSLFPGAKQLVMVRDLVDVIGSIVKQDSRSQPFLMDGQQTLLIKDQVRNYLDPATGLVGINVNAVLDTIDRANGQCLFIRFEDFVAYPKNIMANIHNFFGFEPYEYDFDKVESFERERDLFFNMKFPHTGAGKISPTQRDAHHYMSGEMIEGIGNAFPRYNKVFNYG